MAENKNIVIRLMADTASYEAAMTRAGSTAKTVASGMENTGRKSALIASGMTVPPPSKPELPRFIPLRIPPTRSMI